MPPWRGPHGRQTRRDWGHAHPRPRRHNRRGKPGTPGAGACSKSGCGGSNWGHGRPRQTGPGAPKHPSHAGGNASPASDIVPLGKQNGLKGGPLVAGEIFMRQTSLLQHSGTGIAQVGGLRGNGQHEELRDDAVNPGSSIGVATVPAGSFHAGKVGGIRRRDASGGILF